MNEIELVRVKRYSQKSKTWNNSFREIDAKVDFQDPKMYDNKIS